MKLLVKPREILNFLHSISQFNSILVFHELNTELLPASYGVVYAAKVHGPYRSGVRIVPDLHAKLVYTPGIGLLVTSMNLSRHALKNIEFAVFIPEGMLAKPLKHILHQFLHDLQARGRPWKPRRQQL